MPHCFGGEQPYSCSQSAVDGITYVEVSGWAGRGSQAGASCSWASALPSRTAKFAWRASLAGAAKLHVPCASCLQVSGIILGMLLMGFLAGLLGLPRLPSAAARPACACTLRLPPACAPLYPLLLRHVRRHHWTHVGQPPGLVNHAAGLHPADELRRQRLWLPRVLPRRPVHPGDWWAPPFEAPRPRCSVRQRSGC